MAKLKEVVWRWEYGLYAPFCPHCDEYAYQEDACLFCGKPYAWVEGEFKPTIVSKGRYTAVQSTNNHVTIYEDESHMVMHSACSVKKTEAELLRMIDGYVAFSESGAIEDLYDDESEDGDGATD